jgi:hypothetical protein
LRSPLSYGCVFGVIYIAYAFIRCPGPFNERSGVFQVPVNGFNSRRYTIFLHDTTQRLITLPIKSTYGSDLFSNQLRPGDLSLVCRGREDGLSEVLDSQLANTGADAESFHSIAPEELVTEERLDNGRNPR